MNLINHNAHQSDFDTWLSESWPVALEWFYQAQINDGFIDPHRLDINTLYTQKSLEYNIIFKILINRIRDAYANQVVSSHTPPTLQYCPLCTESIDKIGQHKKQFVKLSLNDRPYILSLTPFPSFEKHFVLSLKDHLPMFMNEHTLEDLLLLQMKLGHTYSIASNSDHAKTGASILSHHHVQILGVHHFPIADAKPNYQTIVSHFSGDVLCEHLHFPATVIRLSSPSFTALITESKQCLHRWRMMDPSNTCNLWIRKNNDAYQIYFILRHPSHETNPSLWRYKTEGIGVIEMCGLGIFPTPKNQTDLILNEIKEKTADLMISLLQSHAPTFQAEHFFRPEL
jgi:UDPglucose--hexose-1-phosphate uridylyltransferase